MSSQANAARLGLEDALPKNPKLRQIPGDVAKYCYKPSIEGIRDKKSFLQFLERHYHEGLGGVTKEMVQESLPKADKILKYHSEKKNIHLHTRPDKKARTRLAVILVLSYYKLPKVDSLLLKSHYYIILFLWKK